MKSKIGLNKKITIGAIVLILLSAIQFYATKDVKAISATNSVLVTLQVDTGISISTGANVTMSPNIGIVSNSSIGGSSWVVKTNGVNGYQLSVKASTAPALQSGANSFADYIPAVAGTPETWTVASGNKEFGFSAYGANVSTATWGTGTDCGTAGNPNALLKYLNLATTDRTIATSNTVTSTSGTQTNICFAAQQNTVYAPSGTYTATITATALTL